jgi:hypothetical protein
MRNIKALLPIIQKISPILKFLISTLKPRSRSQGQMFCYLQKGFVTGYTHVKNQSPGTFHSNDIAMVKVLNK